LLRTDVKTAAIDPPSDQSSLRVAVPLGATLMGFGGNDSASELEQG
jgi:hypothetical protein